MEINNPLSSPFIKGGIPRNAGLLPLAKGGLGGIFFLINSKGISVIFLVIAMLLMITIGYVFSYLIPSKQKSVVFPIHSTQAFFIAQSGVEFAVRYSITQTPPWTTPPQLGGLTGIIRNIGSGRFTLTYTNTAPNLDTLTSIGEVPTGTERRRISVSNFSNFLSLGGLILWIETGVYQDPCFWLFNYQIRFYIKNTSSLPITLNSFSASWDQPPSNRRLIAIRLGSTIVYFNITGYISGSGTADFTSTVTINPNEVIRISLTWNQNIFPNLPVNISFYDTTGEEYPFTLAPTGSCTY